MKKILFCLIALTHFTSAHADDLDTDDSIIFTATTEQNMPALSNDSIQLVGRGIVNRKTNESVAAACMNADCTQIQFVLFEKNGNVTPIGKTYSVVNDQKARKKLLKEIYHQVDEIRRAEVSRTKGTAVFIGSVGAVLEGGHLVVAAGIVSGATFAMICVPLAAGLVFLAATDFNRGSITNAFRDQDGWNWSSRPKKISDVKFNRLVRYLKAQ